MSLKSDLIVVGVAGLVLIAAGWYAKKKVEGAVGGVKNALSSTINAAGQLLKPEPNSAVKATINAPISWFDGQVNSFGQYVTGNDSWNQASWLYKLPEDFGIIDPSEGW